MKGENITAIGLSLALPAKAGKMSQFVLIRTSYVCMCTHVEISQDHTHYTHTYTCNRLD